MSTYETSVFSGVLSVQCDSCLCFYITFFNITKLKETLIPGTDYYGRYGTDNIDGLLQVLVLWLVDGVLGFNQGQAKLDWFPSEVPLRKGKEMFLYNDALNTFYLRLYGVGHMVKDHSDSERGNPLPPHGLLFPTSSKGSFICTIPQTG